MRRLVAVLGVLVLLGSGCGSADLSPPEVGPPDVDVDTPELRRIKAEAGIADCVPGTAAPVEDGLPEVTLPCLGGGPNVQLSGLRGPLVVNLWANWCGPCRRELPLYQEFSEKYAGRVGVLGVDYKDVMVDRALAMAQDTGATYPQLADPAGDLEATEAFRGIRGLPVLALVDAEGRVVHRAALEITSLAQLEDLVEEHLGVTARG